MLIHKAMPHPSGGFCVAYQRPTRKEWTIAVDGFDALRSAQREAERLNREQRMRQRRLEETLNEDLGQRRVAHGFYEDD